jgi:large subunit ribosomal protein L18e
MVEVTSKRFVYLFQRPCGIYLRVFKPRPSHILYNHTNTVNKMKRIKSNQTQQLIASLKTLAIAENTALWKRVAVELEKPSRSKREVNIYKLESCAKEGEIVIVPGKVLGNGVLSKKITVAALAVSQSAQDKISSNNGEVLTIQELMKTNPKGSKVRIMG